MPELVPGSPPEFSVSLPALTTESVAHPDTWNPIHQLLLDNTAYLRDALGLTDEELAALISRVDGLEETSAVAVQRAVLLDWLYRDNRIAFELWAPGFTLIDAVDTPIISGISGDDSVDVEDTSQLHVGAYYVLSDTTGNILIKCTAILSANRIRIDINLPRNLGEGVLTRCTMDYANKANALCEVGDIWLSKIVNIGDDQKGGAVIVRRSLNSAQCRLYYMDAYKTTWTETVWSMRRQGGDIPEGFADYEYILPMRGDGCLKMAIEGEAVTICHIVVVSAATGLGGYVNEALRPNAPTISTPADGATGIMEEPTLSIASYSSSYGVPHAGTQFNISTAENFATVLHDSGTVLGLSYLVPSGVLSVSTQYYLRARVKDVAGLWSDWSVVTDFTTAATFDYVKSPTIVSPANNAVDVIEQPTIQTGAFAVQGQTEDTHAASQWQIRAATGTWASPVWDSGEDADNLLSRVVPSGKLEEGKKEYYIRARHKGTTLGWSAWSSEVHITTKQVFANIIGVACTATGGGGGTWVHVDQSGNTITPGASYFNDHPVFGGIQDVTIDSQSMVKIPKFYIKRATISGGANDGKEAWWISDQLVSGFSIHPAFRSGSSDINQVYVGKYQASSDGTKMKSVSGVLPAVSKSLTTFQSEASARNTGGVTGFMLWSMFQWSAIQWLYLVENKTMDSQTKTGAGRVNKSSAAKVDASDVAQATYRGIVGLWGNVYQWIDGLKTDSSGHINLWDRDGNKGWVDTGKKRSAADGVIYPTTFMSDSGTGYDFDDVFIGNTGPTSNSDATAPDYQYFTTGEYFPIVGGYWGFGADAGLWSVDCGYAASDSHTHIGARLAKV